MKKQDSCYQTIHCDSLRLIGVALSKGIYYKELSINQQKTISLLDSLLKLKPQVVYQDKIEYKNNWLLTLGFTIGGQILVLLLILTVHK